MVAISNPATQHDASPIVKIIFLISLIGFVILALVFLLSRCAGRGIYPNTQIAAIATPIVRLKPETTQSESYETWASRMGDIAPSRVPSDPSCVICLDEIKDCDEVCALECLHFYHRDCFNSILAAGIDNCPVCKTPMTQMKEPTKPERALCRDFMPFMPV